MNFGLYPVRAYNDYAFDISNNNSLFTQISLMKYNDPASFRRLREFIESYRSEQVSDQYLAAMGYCRYAEKDFEEGIKYITRILEFNPSNIDAWIDLCFFLAHIPDGYETYLNMRFHLYYFMHLYHQYDFHTVSQETIAILDRLVADLARTPEVRGGYHKKPGFDTEYLIVNGACNNNCETCHVPPHLRAYDFEDRTTRAGLVSLSKYIFAKVRKKRIRHIVLKGGEPTLHPAYLKIVKTVSAARGDVTIHVRTNARTFCNTDFLQRHVAAKAKNIIFETSIFSSDPCLHDDISRTPGSHEQTLRGMNNLLEQGFRVSARVGVCDKNAESISDTLDFLWRTFGASVNYMGADLALPPPSANNIAAYYPHGIQTLKRQAQDAIAQRSQVLRPPVILNQALAQDC